MPSLHEDPKAQHRRRGFSRLLHATRYSWHGLLVAWRQPAFRLEVILFLLACPLGWMISQSLGHYLTLLGLLWLVLIIELLNTAIEKAIDRIGPEWHTLSKEAKDLGSAAILMTCAATAAVWGLALVQFFS